MLIINNWEIDNAMLSLLTEIYLLNLSLYNFRKLVIGEIPVTIMVFF